MREQGDTEVSPVIIEDDVWIWEKGNNNAGCCYWKRVNNWCRRSCD